MADNHQSRFHARTVAEVVTVNRERRLELSFRGAGAESIVVSLPLEEALALARLICDYHEHAPFLKHAGHRASGRAK